MSDSISPIPPAGRLPPTTAALLADIARPYFRWWTDTTVGQLKKCLLSSDPEERAYWMGALLRSLAVPGPVPGSLPADVGLAAPAPTAGVAAAAPDPCPGCV